DHFREPPQTPSSFSALCRLLRHDRTTSAFVYDVDVFLTCSSISSATTIAITTVIQALPAWKDRF
ncbi:unnamed protein product, partial [Brassica rapa subsp. narinosa]